MAAIDVIQKAEIYHILYQINSSFANHFTALQQAGVLTSKFTREFQAFTQELQSEFNQDFLLDWHQAELEDWYRFGKARQAQEKRLRDPDDAFIHARERERELAKHGRKSRKKSSPKR